MIERWTRQSVGFTYIYDVDRLHGTAAYRILTPDKGIKRNFNADRDLLDGKLSETELMARGYQRV